MGAGNCSLLTCWIIKMIDWISLDDVLYRWDGQQIVCETDVGYSFPMEGHRLDGLELYDGMENISGRLFVDFIDITLISHLEIMRLDLLNENYYHLITCFPFACLPI